MKLRFVIQKCLLGLAALTVNACASTDTKPKPLSESLQKADLSNNQPALLSAMTPDIRQDISNIIAARLERPNVTIASRSFTQKSSLIVSRRPVRSIDVPNGEGRILDIAVHHFDLFISGDTCFISHRQSGKIDMLSGIDCVAVQTDE